MAPSRDRLRVRSVRHRSVRRLPAHHRGDERGHSRRGCRDWSRVIALDTNVLARALAEDDETQSPAAQKLLLGLSAESPGFINLTVTVELYWVLRQVLGIEAQRVHAIFDRLLATPAFEIEDGESVSEALEHARLGADFADALIEATNRLYGVTETATFDHGAARRFGWRLLR
ncbi:MAG: PIN domain-containing protein [Microbacterium sp.]|nr:MAG: PIN domain-containing protein [Microbacterium sp.]